MLIPQQNAYTAATAGVQLVNRAGGLHLVALTAAAAAATCAIYDNTFATGNPILALAVPANTSICPDSDGFTFNVGLFVVVTGAGATLNIHFE